VTEEDSVGDVAGAPGEWWADRPPSFRRESKNPRFIATQRSCGPKLTNLTSFTFNIGSKQKLYLVSKIDLIGQGYFGSTYNYYHFSTGYNVISDINGNSTNFTYRHIPGHFSHIFNKSGSTNSATIVSVGPDKQFQNFTNLASSFELSLQPKFSTITTPLDTTIIQKYPIVKASINSSTQGSQDDKLVLTIQAQSIQSNEKIDWFGSVEFFASIV
jgi:hypothetical protein